MNKINFKEIIIFLIIIICTFILKNKFTSEIIVNNNASVVLDRLLVMYEVSNKLNYINVIWMIPIISTLFFVCRNSFNYLLNFSIRYRNRKTGYKVCIISHSIQIIIYSLISVFIQYILLTIFNDVQLVYTFDFVIIILKYVSEIIFISFCVMFLSIFMKNFSYALLFCIIVPISLLNLFYPSHIIPFVSLYSERGINIVTIISSLLLIQLLRKLYFKLDFIGRYEQ